MDKLIVFDLAMWIALLALWMMVANIIDKGSIWHFAYPQVFVDILNYLLLITLVFLPNSSCELVFNHDKGEA